MGVDGESLSLTDPRPTLPQQHKDGVSFVELLKDPKAEHPRAPLFWHYPHWGNQGGIPSSAIREGNWKLVDNYWKKGVELFDLGSDPGEQHNLAVEKPEKAAALKAKLDQLRQDTDALAPTPNPKAKGNFNKW